MSAVQAMVATTAIEPNVRNELNRLNAVADAEITNAVPAQYIAEDAIARRIMDRVNSGETDISVSVGIPEDDIPSPYYGPDSPNG